VIPFAAQHRGMSLRKVVNDYHEAATPKAVIDYAFHLIITDPSPQALGRILRAVDHPRLGRDARTPLALVHGRSIPPSLRLALRSLRYAL
jgi:hypothetical protein